MDTLDSLNIQYIRIKNNLIELKGCLEKITAEQSKTILSNAGIKEFDCSADGKHNKAISLGLEKAFNSLQILKTLLKTIDCQKYSQLCETVYVGSKYFDCVSAINNYKTALLNANGIITDFIFESIKSVKETNDEFSRYSKAYQTKYHEYIGQLDALNLMFVKSLNNAILAEKAAISQLKEKAKEIVNADNNIELRITDSIQTDDTLPESILVARQPVKKVMQDILKDIGISSTYNKIYSDLRENGNIIINTDFEHLEDDIIDDFVISYILRLLSSFPIGSLQIHIFDKNTKYLYKRLNNIFHSENASENVKKVVQIHSEISEFSTLTDVICEDIFKKVSVETNDLYSIYETDKSDSFTLFILRDGLVGSYANFDVLDAIRSRTQPRELGHKCGLRFLIVDDSDSRSKDLTSQNAHLIKSIKDNCELKIVYSIDSFAIDKKDVEVLKIKGNVEAFVQERSILIAEAINGKQKNIISLQDIAASCPDIQLGSIMYIPIGKSGNDVVELPLSCKDDDGTVAGQCIGYMAIGQSGSGKSSFFHSMVLEGCMRYSPQDLQFWLLDFKNGGASSKYSKSGIPHIKIIAENNKIDDAFCLFKMILEEMERRSKAFNKNFTDNIVEYNIKAQNEGLEYFPRIIIAIDEVQEIFREDNAAEIQKQISSISTRMRSAGMHFVMVAQNLSEGKSYMLKEAFLPSATGRICFRVAQDIPRDSGFDEDFINRRNEINELKTGEAYISYGKGTIKKVKIAYVSPQDMTDKYFSDICRKYPEYSNMCPRVIGSKKRLSVRDNIQGAGNSYYDLLNGITSSNGVYNVLIGEDVYRMEPFSIQFSQRENSSLLFLGGDKAISSSLCASTAISLIHQNAKVYLFNADRTKIHDDDETVDHPFMRVCQTVNGVNCSTKNYKLDQLKDVVRDLYSEYLKRQREVQQADDEDPVFEPVFMIINDLLGVESFIDNEVIESNNSKDSPTSVTNDGLFDYDLFGNNNSPTKEAGQFRDNIQNILGVLLKNGGRYNIHLIIAVKGDSSSWRNSHIVSDINKLVLFNDTNYADRIENAYYLKETLKNISNDGNEETMAVWASGKSFSKLRPIIYKLSIANEKEALDNLVEGV